MINLPTKKLCYTYKNVSNEENIQKKYVVGGDGIFYSIGNFFARLFSSNSAKQLASTALQAGKTAAKDIGMKAIDVGKTVANDAGKKLVEKAARKLLTPKSQEIIAKYANATVQPEQGAKNVKEALANYFETGAININKMIDGSSLCRPAVSNTIAIKDLVKRLNGSGLQEI